jgi:amidase
MANETGDDNLVPAWETIAHVKRANRDNAIPPEWRLRNNIPESRLNVINVPAECGILTARELTITETDATVLVDKLISREYSSREVRPSDQF